MTEPTSVTLSKPLPTHGGEITTLIFKHELRARDLLRHGSPIRELSTRFPDGSVSSETEIRYSAAFGLLSAMTGLDAGELELMPARDLDRALAVVFREVYGSLGRDNPVGN